MHVILVAIAIAGKSREEAERNLYPHLPLPEVEMEGYPTVDCWWIAEDERYDRSDSDSAVFCAPGKQREARALLEAHGLV